MKNSSLPGKIAFIDTETTGFSLARDRVIEIGILRVEDGRLTKIFQSLINPGFNLPLEIELLTGIKRHELDNAPSFRQIKDEIIEILDGCIFAAHNARFDYGFLKKEFKLEDLTFKAKQLCTAKLTRKLFPQFKKFNLDNLIEKFGIECLNRHRAFDDAKVLFDFYKKILESFSKEKLIKVFNDLSNRPSLPMHISKKMIADLHEGPGVYIFSGKNGVPLYVGKSLNVKARVLSHFSSDITSSRERAISSQVENIEIKPCAGELGALIKEAQLIRKLLPIYNRAARFKQTLSLLIISENQEGYKTLELVESTQINPEDLNILAGIFKNKKAAKNYLVNLAKENKLCDKLLGLEKTKGGCFGSRISNCLGACLGKEDVKSYNLRFDQALFKNKLKSWPFSGPILIEEFDPQTSLNEGHLFDKWCYLGTIKQIEGQESFNEVEMMFDFEIYKILERALRKNEQVLSFRNEQVLSFRNKKSYRIKLIDVNSNQLLFSQHF